MISHCYQRDEFYDLTNKEFKIVVLRNSMSDKKIQKKFNEIRTKVCEQNEKFNKEIEIIKENQIEILKKIESKIKKKKKNSLQGSTTYLILQKHQ